MISIIVPIYNSEKWLRKCIDSLINQTYKNIEILLINDGSKDKSIEICREYAQKDKRIIVIDKPNEGVSATRNLGIKKAKGQYIQFVDSDDYIEPQTCERLASTMENADMVICGMRIWRHGVVLREPHLQKGIFTLKEDIDIYFKLRKINLGPCNKLYRKAKILHGFREDLSLGEDTLFVIDYMRNVKTVSILEECLYNVVLDNEDSLNHQSKSDKIDSLLEQRVLEEQFLHDIYGQNCNMTEMYNCYLLLFHSHFLSLAQNKKLKKALISKYTDSDFFQHKIKLSLPTRFDYKIFKLLFVKKATHLLCIYFKAKILYQKTK